MHNFALTNARLPMNRLPCKCRLYLGDLSARWRDATHTDCLSCWV